MRTRLSFGKLQILTLRSILRYFIKKSKKMKSLKENIPYMSEMNRLEMLNSLDQRSKDVLLSLYINDAVKSRK